MNRKQWYRRFVCMLLAAALTGLVYCSWEALRGQIPEQIQVAASGEVPLLFDGILEQIIETEKRESMEVSASGTHTELTDYELSCSLFGRIPLKTVSVSVAQREQVYAGGTSIGIYLETDGVLVVDTGAVTDSSGELCCPAQHIVRSGDYIQTVNGTRVTTKEELIDCIRASDGAEVVFDIDRQGEPIQLSVQPVLDAGGTYRAGIWVRNNTQGIGTLTYLKDNGTFGALGHGISDIDTGKLLDISGGTLYESQVVSVVKGEQGMPGELTGVIRYSDGYKIGTITANQENGIYGTVIGLPSFLEGRKKYETAFRHEAEKGPAVILSCVDGTCREYEAEIREIRLNGSDVNKGMILEVTDPRLLELTGGIVQGMSGSPIIQNGRLIGAVTHVLVNDPTKGYGIFIENMLEY